MVTSVRPARKIASLPSTVIENVAAVATPIGRNKIAAKIKILVLTELVAVNLGTSALEDGLLCLTSFIDKPSLLKSN
jgi:hypothetical protein